jgi:hypothetical protein
MEFSLVLLFLLLLLGKLSNLPLLSYLLKTIETQ